MTMKEIAARTARVQEQQSEIECKLAALQGMIASAQDDEPEWTPEDDDYTSSAWDYSPSTPWNAPGMSARDFVR